MVFHDSLASVREDTDVPGYVTVIERAWREMGLHGVLCLDGRPVLYLREYDQPCSSSERIRLHKLFWNQGVANVLVLIDPVSVFLYSGLVPPGKEAAEKALVDTIQIADFAQRIRILFQQLATGHFYEIHRKKFDPEQSVDERLLENLGDFRNGLVRDDKESEAKGLEIKEAHAFMGRVLFLCYLLDRGIFRIGGPDRGGTGTTLLAKELESREDDKARIEYLYGLFEELRDRFNGNMFDRDLDAERRRIHPSHLHKLSLFLQGGEVETGQMALWPYDFKMIPVETISAVYQNFLAAEDKEGQRETGAFYTPRFLAEMVVDVAMGKEPGAWDWSYLDPACGSGIFLVILFNRIASRRLAGIDAEDYSARTEALRNILTRQIRGVDISETACRIACFSLYLAYLDFFDPPDIERYIDRNGRLPKLLHDPGDPGQSTADILVIHKADSLALDDNALANEAVPDGKFDCVIGNPPWGKKEGKNQITWNFLWRAPGFLKDNGAGCLLLPTTKILHNQTDVLQARWISGITLEKVLQLADYRKLLFESARSLGFIARFTNTTPDPYQHKVEFIAPKFNRDGLRKGVITIGPATRAWIRLADVLAAAQSKTAPVVWKQHLWGTRRDRKFLDLLQSLPPLSDLAGGPKEGKRWIKGVGFQPNTSGKAKNPKLPWWNKEHLYIGAGDSFWESGRIHIREDDCGEIGNRFPSLRRSPDKRIYKGPMVLVSKGSTDIKVVYCSFDVLFRDFLQSIAGKEEDTELLMFLATYFRSKLVKYFLFHTSAYWGIERDQTYVKEYLRLPFPLPGDEFIAPDAAEIVAEVAEKVHKLGDDLQEQYERLKAETPEQGELFDQKVNPPGKNIDAKKWQRVRKRLTDDLQVEIEPLIYRYFGLTEQEKILVEDTVDIFFPSATPNKWNADLPTLAPVKVETRFIASDKKSSPYGKQGLCAYGSTLAGTLNSWVGDGRSRYRVRAEVGADGETGLAMATLHLVEGEPAEICRRMKSLSPSLADALRHYRETLSEKTGTLLYERDILFFQGDCIHIVRPNLLINWTRTMALNDAAQIYGEILLRKRKANAG